MPETTITKTCRTCKQNKPIFEFNKAPGNRDGYNNQCKICDRQRGKEYRKTERGKQIHRKAVRCYSKTEKNKALQKRYRQSKKGQTARKHYKKNYPERAKASNKVLTAIRNGILSRIKTLRCACGNQAHHYHHHKGYAKKHWLDVIPVCAKCHNKAH